MENRLNDQHAKGPVFVVGPARSGTTFVQSLITAMPGFYSCPETHFFDELMAPGPVCGAYQLHRPRLRLQCNGIISEKHLLESFQKAKNGFLKISPQTQEQLLIKVRTGSLSPRDFLCMIMESYRPDKPLPSRYRWVEKTPIHGSYLEEIFLLYPDAQIVLVKREPEGVLSSAASMFNVPICIAALDYYRIYRDIGLFLTKYPTNAEQILGVSYEELINSDDAIEHLIHFLKAGDTPPHLIRKQARECFHQIYNESIMQAIQPKMRDPSYSKGASPRSMRIIRGYSSTLRKISDPKSTRHNMCILWRENLSFRLALYMMLDLFYGAIYIAMWRMKWVINLVLWHLVSMRSTKSCN